MIMTKFGYMLALCLGAYGEKRLTYSPAALESLTGVTLRVALRFG